jgi:hypothetical protein
MLCRLLLHIGEWEEEQVLTFGPLACFFVALEFFFLIITIFITNSSQITKI